MVHSNLYLFNTPQKKLQLWGSLLLFSMSLMALQKATFVSFCFIPYNALNQVPSENTVLMVLDKCQIFSYTATNTSERNSLYVSFSFLHGPEWLATWLHSNAQSYTVHVQNLPVQHDYFLTMTHQMEVHPPSTKEVSTSNVIPCHKPKTGNLKLVLKYTRSLQTSLQCLQVVCVAQ